MVVSNGEEQYVGCTGVPVDSHEINWMTVSKDRPIERCIHCGNVVKMDYIGPEDPHRMFLTLFGYLHANFSDGHPPAKWEPETIADYIKPEYYYK